MLKLFFRSFFCALFVVLFAAAEARCVTLAWDPPTTNSDGTPLTDLGGYAIWVTQTSGDYTNATIIDVGNVTSYTFTTLAPGDYYVVVLAYDTSSPPNYSDPSDEVSFTIQGTAVTISVSKAGSGGGTVTGGPGNLINCGSTCSAQTISGAAVTLTATPNTGSSFAGWSGACSGTGSCTFTPSTNATVSATFTIQRFTLSVAKVGNGTITGSGISCGADCSETFNYGTSVNLSAAPAAGATFNGWSGSCTGTGSCVVSMTQARSVTATFTTPSAVTLSVSKTGNGSGTITGGPINCGATCSGSVISGSTVTLTASPSSNSTFSGWSGACTGLSTCSVTPTAATSVTATFALRQYTVTISKAGTGSGTVTGGAINCGATCSTAVNSGTVITFTATPATGSTFTGWSGACTGTGTCKVTVTANSAATATFAKSSQFSLTVTKAGTGSGTVSGAGINCGTTCSTNANSGTVITLTASPASGSTFSGWSGSCSGTGACSVTLSQARAVTATFAANQYQVSITKSGSGSGTILGGTINCGTVCASTVTHGTNFTITATAAVDSLFFGWSGSCTGTQNTCAINANATTNVGARFELKEKVTPKAPGNFKLSAPTN